MNQTAEAFYLSTLDAGKLEAKETERRSIGRMITS